MPESANIARHLPLMAARQPGHPAVKVPRGRTARSGIDYLTLSFAELDTEVDAWVARLRARGVQRGDRTLVMVRQGLPLIASAFALFKLGAVPVIIDPGMGRKAFLACVARSRPRVLLGIPLAQLLSHVFRSSFASVETRLWVSGSATARQPAAAPPIPERKSQIPDSSFRDSPGSADLANRKAEFANPSAPHPSALNPQPSRLDSQPVASAAADLAAVLFTSGSTGAPKGVCYEHGMFDAQVRLVRATYGIEPGEVDLPMLPIFALFNPALGMTTVVPEIDPSRPATVNPARIVQAVLQEKVTNSFGSPTLWRKIAGHCREHGLTLPTLRRVLMAGAPVPPALFADMQSILPNGTAFSPYGATEALPVSSISAREVLGTAPEKVQTPDPKGQTGGAKDQGSSNKDQGGDPTSPGRDLGSSAGSALFGTWPLALGPSAGTAAATAAGHGTCVGRPVAEVEVKIIALTDGPLASLDAARELPAGEIGEIIVRGPAVTREYDQLPEETALAKIPTPKAKLQTDTSPNDQSGRRPAEVGTSVNTPGAQDSFGVWPLAFGVSGAGAPSVWHRLGDVGYLDAHGRLWFCGRKAERVETSGGPLYTEQIEPLFHAHPDVRRTALIGLGERGRQRAAIVVEPVAKAVVATPSLRRKLVRELRALGARHPLADRVRLAFLHPAFPVDVRHNAKIHRLALARWAAHHTGYEMDRREIKREVLRQ